MKKKISVILAIIVFVCSVNTSFANNTNDFAPDFVVDIVETRFDGKELCCTKELYDLNNNNVGQIMIFSPVGYIAFNNNDIYEMSTEATYNIDLNKKIYYFGPLQIYQKSGDVYIDLLSNTSCSYNDLEEANRTFNEILSSEASSASVANSGGGISTYAYVEDRIPYDTRAAYDYNPNDKCGSLALAITLMYYDDHINSYMVPDWIANADTDGEYFVNLLTPHIEGLDSSYKGSTCEDIASGANWYFRYRGVNSQYSSTYVNYPTYSSYKELIHADKPVIVLIRSHPTYIHHWVVGYGYYHQTTGSSSRELMIVNDGWGQVGREINFSYVRSLVYING